MRGFFIDKTRRRLRAVTETETETETETTVMLNYSCTTSIRHTFRIVFSHPPMMHVS